MKTILPVLIFGLTLSSTSFAAICGQDSATGLVAPWCTCSAPELSFDNGVWKFRGVALSNPVVKTVCESLVDSSFVGEAGGGWYSYTTQMSVSLEERGRPALHANVTCEVSNDASASEPVFSSLALPACK